jgi:two-component system sensor histidine kinase BaeS
MVAAGLFLFLQWSFDRGFLNYVKGQELDQLDQLAERLSGYYAEQGNWQFIEGNHHLWVRLHREIFILKGRLDQGMPSQAGRFQQQNPPPRDPLGMGGRQQDPQPADALGMEGRQQELPPVDPVEVGARIVLFDADKHKIIGGPLEEMGNLTLRPISHQNKTIGYLGLIPVTEVSYSGDLRFVQQQTQTFGLVALIMLAVSLLLSYPVTVHLLRPIRQLTDGTLRLIGGKFKTRIPVTTGDELGQLSAHFNILAMTLEKNEKSRRQWVADISHELRTPLSVLRGEVEALQDGIRPLGPKTLDPLHSEIMHLERLVNDLYELSMSDIGALNYKRIAVNPVGILAGTLELFEQRFAGKGVEITTSIPEDFHDALLGDPDRLHQLFTNVLENTLRYTDAPGTLNVSVKKKNEYIVIDFQDSAPGVKETQLPQLFERLFRVDQSRHREGSGAGLGLSICQNIVEAHLGKITGYASSLGGLGIKIELPLSS